MPFHCKIVNSPACFGHKLKFCVKYTKKYLLFQLCACLHTKHQTNITWHDDFAKTVSRRMDMCVQFLCWLIPSLCRAHRGQVTQWSSIIWQHTVSCSCPYWCTINMAERTQNTPPGRSGYLLFYLFYWVNVENVCFTEWRRKNMTCFQDYRVWSGCGLES